MNFGRVGGDTIQPVTIPATTEAPWAHGCPTTQAGEGRGCLGVLRTPRSCRRRDRGHGRLCAARGLQARDTESEPAGGCRPPGGAVLSSPICANLPPVNFSSVLEASFTYPSTPSQLSLPSGPGEGQPSMHIYRGEWACVRFTCGIPGARGDSGAIQDAPAC